MKLSPLIFRRDHIAALALVATLSVSAGEIWEDYEFAGHGFRERGQYSSAIDNFTLAIKNNRTAAYRANSYYERALCYQALGKPQLWLEDINAAIAADPTDRPYFYTCRAEAKHALGDFAGAVADYRAARDHAAKLYNYRDSLGDYVRRYHDEANALTYNLEARDHPEIYQAFRAAQEKQQAGDLAAAIAGFTSVIERDPRWLPALLERTRCKLKLQDFRGAQEDAEALLRFDSSRADFHWEHAQTAAGLLQWEIHLADLEKALSLAEQNQLPETAHYRTTLQTARASLAERVEARDHPDAYSLYQRGLAKHEQKDFVGAIADFEAASHAHLGFRAYSARLVREQTDLIYNVEARDNGDAYASYESGRKNFDAEKFAAAAADFGWAIQFDPAWAPGYYWRSRAKTTLKDYQGAAADIARAMELAPDRAEFHQQASIVASWLNDDATKLAETQKALDLAESAGLPDQNEYRRALWETKQTVAENRLVRGHPDAFAHFKLVGEKATAKDYAGALKEIETAMALYPDCALFYWSRGNLRHHLNDNRGWVDDLTKAIELDPEDHNHLHDRAEALGSIKPVTRELLEQRANDFAAAARWLELHGGAPDAVAAYRADQTQAVDRLAEFLSAQRNRSRAP